MKKGLILLLLPLMLAGCNGTPSESTSATPTESGDHPTTDPTGGPTTSGFPTDTSSIPDEGNVKTITFEGMDWTGTLTQSGKPAEFVNAVNSDILSSVTATGYVQVNEFGDNTNKLCVGSASSNGSITFNYSKTVTQVEYCIQAYYKPYTGGVSKDSAPYMVNVDNYAVTINSTEENEIPEKKSIISKFEQGTKSSSVSVFFEKNRLFVHSIKVTLAD